jgi:5-methylcytosine-specific restriction protein A
MTTLAEGGADTINNVIALCPNCHRKLHYSDKREMLKEQLYGKIIRLNIYQKKYV